MKIAIIDVGSNSVRIGIFASGKIVFRDKINCQLAEGMAFDGLLKKEAIKRSFSAVKKFVEMAIVFGVERENIHCFATASVRNSANGNEFVEMVKNYFDAIKTENDTFLPTFNDEILLVDLLRKKENYSKEIFEEALNNFKLNANHIDFWYVENELLDYRKIDLCCEYVPKLDCGNKKDNIRNGWLYNMY